MSSGEFTNTLYELSADNGGGIAPVRVQPETLSATINGAANDAPAGPATLPVSAKVSGGNREIGINCRTVNLEFTGAPPTDYSGDNVTIPVMTPATFAAWTVGQTGTYLGVDVRVAGRSPERVR